MTWLAALLPLLAAGPGLPGTAAPAPSRSAAIRSVASPILRPPAPRAPAAALRADRQLRAVEMLRPSLDSPAGGLGPERPLLCGELACAPDRGALPGDPRPPHGTRRDLVLALLARTPFEKLSSAANAIAAAPILIDYTPGGTGRERGWGRLEVGFRWRLDATGPVRSGGESR